MGKGFWRFSVRGKQSYLSRFDDSKVVRERRSGNETADSIFAPRSLAWYEAASSSP
jgi:hypothetical protein